MHQPGVVTSNCTAYGGSLVGGSGCFLWTRRRGGRRAAMCVWGSQACQGIGFRQGLISRQVWGDGRTPPPLKEGDGDGAIPT